MAALQVSILMQRDLLTGSWFVDSITSSRGPIRNKTSFLTPMPFDMVFVPDLVRMLGRYLPTRADHLVHSVDRLTCPGVGVVLEKVRIIAQQAYSGVQSVTVRVQCVVGRLADLFLPSIALDAVPVAAPESHSHRLAPPAPRDDAAARPVPQRQSLPRE